MPAYYNENDPVAAAWLRNLITAGLIAPGDVDDRSITEVQANDLAGYTQCHFFAGIGGWSYALRLAGWPDDRQVWTGSCPCQPFSAAGKGKGFDDDRHLWPEWFRLLREFRPDVVFGEQVAAATTWLDLVCGDLEAEGYTCGAIIMGAHSVGAPHIRQRLYWVADDEQSGLERSTRTGLTGARGSSEQSATQGILGHSDHPRSQGWGLSRSTRRGDGADQRSLGSSSLDDPRIVAESVSGLRREECAEPSRSGSGSGTEGLDERSGCRGAWNDLLWLPCLDGKSRPTQPGLFPLAHGVPTRVGRLRGYGNAIVPQVAQAFIEAYEACRSGVTHVSSHCRRCSADEAGGPDPA